MTERDPRTDPMQPHVYTRRTGKLTPELRDDWSDCPGSPIFDGGMAYEAYCDFMERNEQMTYECEFTNGYVAPVVTVSRLPDYNIGLARDQRGYKRVLFYTPAGHHPDPWVVAVRPADAAAAYRIAELSPAPGPQVDGKA